MRFNWVVLPDFAMQSSFVFHLSLHSPAPVLALRQAPASSPDISRAMPFHDRHWKKPPKRGATASESLADQQAISPKHVLFLAVLTGNQ